MRISNLQFAKGSIIYARFPQEMDYLNGRPLIVVSDHIPVYDCVWVVKCGTRGKAGINISLFNYATKDYIGGQQVTTIYPYNIYTVKVSQIISTIGILDRRVMKKVDEAIDFFTGRSDVVPEFLSAFATELTDVTYQPALQPYTQINEGIGPEYEYKHNSSIYPVQTINGDNAWNVPASEIPEIEQPSEGGVRIPKVRTDTVKSVPKKEKRSSSNITEDKIAEFLTLQCKLGLDQKTSARVLTDAYNNWSKTPVSIISFSRVLNGYLTRINSLAKRDKVNGQSYYIGIGLCEPVEESPDKHEPLPPVNFELFSIRDTDTVRNWACVNRFRIAETVTEDNILNILGADSSIPILSRQASIGAIQNKFGVSNEEAIALQDQVQKASMNIGNKIISKIMKHNLDPDNLNEYEKVAVVIACKIYGFGNSPKVRVKLNKLIQNTLKAYRIDFQEKAIWGNVITY